MIAGAVIYIGLIGLWVKQNKKVNLIGVGIVCVLQLLALILGLVVLISFNPYKNKIFKSTKSSI